MSSIEKLVEIFGNILADALITIFEAGGNPALAFLACLAIIGVFARSAQEAGKVFITLFMICIAFPFLLFEEIYYKIKYPPVKRD